jgi:VanZ family protein
MRNWSTSWQHWFRRALPAYWIFLFCATHFPKPKLPGRLPREDKLIHFAAFGVLAFLFWRCGETMRPSVSNRFVWIAFACLALYAAVDEYLQQFVNRHTSWTDWLANLVGIAAVLTVLEVHRRWRRSAEKAHAGLDRT